MNIMQIVLPNEYIFGWHHHFGTTAFVDKAFQNLYFINNTIFNFFKLNTKGVVKYSSDGAESTVEILFLLAY